MGEVDVLRTSLDRALRAVVVLVALAGCGRVETRPAERPEGLGPNVVVVLIDTLRRDHLSLYGYERWTSPAIDALGAAGHVFDNHISHSGQTVPSTLSLLVSKVPAEHGFLHAGPGHFSSHPPLYGDELLFLAEVYRAAGYRTGGFVANPFLKEKNGFAQGFEHFVHDEGRGETLTREAERFLERHAAERFFAYVHLMDVHNPYDPPRPYRDLYPGPEAGKLVYRNGPAPDATPEDLSVTIGLYDAQIRYTDELVGGLLARLEALGLRRHTIVALTSDHGDEFLEHGGLGHGTSVYGELVRVPLVLSAPGRLEAGRRISHLTQHLDVAPTLLELSGLEKPEAFRGRSLYAPAEVVYTEDGPWRAAYADGGKLVENVETSASELFRESDLLDASPVEDPALRAKLSARLRAYGEIGAARRERDGGTSAAAAWTEEELEQLRALGYAE